MLQPVANSISPKPLKNGLTWLFNPENMYDF